jgi:hypothetical protein
MLGVQQNLYGIQTDDPQGLWGWDYAPHAAGCFLDHLPAVIAGSL